MSWRRRLVFCEHLPQVLHVVVIADRHQHATGPRVQGGGVDLRLMVQIEFFQRSCVRRSQLALLGVNVFRDGEDDEHNQGEADAVIGGVLLGEQIGDRDETQNQGRYAQADRDLHAGESNVEGELVFLIVPLITQRQHAQRLQEKAPHHAERIRFTQQINIAAAEDDGGDLQQRDQC